MMKQSELLPSPYTGDGSRKALDGVALHDAALAGALPHQPPRRSPQTLHEAAWAASDSGDRKKYIAALDAMCTHRALASAAALAALHRAEYLHHTSRCGPAAGYSTSADEAAVASRAFARSADLAFRIRLETESSRYSLIIAVDE